MIIRIFRVRIDANLRDEFESKFATVSIQAVKSQDGFLSVQIGKSSKWTPDEYVMITQWDNENALEQFVGEAWNQPHIPDGMEKYVKECWVHHYYDYATA